MSHFSYYHIMRMASQRRLLSLFDKLRALSDSLPSALTKSALVLLLALLSSACSDNEKGKQPLVNDSAQTSLTSADTQVSESAALSGGDRDTKKESAELREPETTLAADVGRSLYERQCRTCHQSGLLDAPKFGDKAEWQSHLMKDKAVLYEHSAQGFNKMPPQAVDGVSEAQVQAAVDYMLAAVS